MENSSGQTPPPPAKKRRCDWIGYALAVIAIAVAIYYGIDAHKVPQLSYYINSHRTAILQKGNLTELNVSFQGFPVNGDVSSVEIVFWNAGKQPIKLSDILSPVVIKFRDNVYCYQGRAEASRDVIMAGIFPNFEPFISENKKNRVISVDGIGVEGKNGYQLAWNILEQGDSIKLDMIYGGDVNEPIFVKGVIEGQKNGIVKYNKVDEGGVKVLAIISGVMFFYFSLLSIFIYFQLKRYKLLTYNSKVLRYFTTGVYTTNAIIGILFLYVLYASHYSPFPK
jgi:hypothetical protein